MTTETVARNGLADWLAANAENVVRYVCLAAVAGYGFAGAFTHMHDWTSTALPTAPDWMCWGNAVISEILPTLSFLSWRDRARRGRGTRVPVVVFMGSVLVSLVAQQTAAGVVVPGAKYFLAALPMLALLVLSKMVFSDLDYARREREASAAAAELRAEQARKQAELRAEQAAELAAEQARKQAELERRQAAEAAELEAERAQRLAAQEAELAREAREHEARLQREAHEAQAAERLRLAEIEQAAITRREQREAADRQAEREARLAIEREAALAEAAGRAEALRLRAEAEAAQMAAETVRLETETKIREQAVSRLTGRHAAAGEGRGESAPADLGDARRSRRPRAETAALIQAVLDMQPTGTTRADAVKAAAHELSVSRRYVSDFIPDPWPVVSSDADAA